jgi:hypothetical protein
VQFARDMMVTTLITFDESPTIAALASPEEAA